MRYAGAFARQSFAFARYTSAFVRNTSHSCGAPSHSRGTPSHSRGTPSHSRGRPSHSSAGQLRSCGTTSHLVGATFTSCGRDDHCVRHGTHSSGTMFGCPRNVIHSSGRTAAARGTPFTSSDTSLTFCRTTSSPSGKAVRFSGLAVASRATSFTSVGRRSSSFDVPFAPCGTGLIAGWGCDERTRLQIAHTSRARRAMSSRGVERERDELTSQVVRLTHHHQATSARATHRDDESLPAGDVVTGNATDLRGVPLTSEHARCEP